MCVTGPHSDLLRKPLQVLVREGSVPDCVLYGWIKEDAQQAGRTSDIVFPTMLHAWSDGEKLPSSKRLGASIFELVFG